MYRNRTRAVLTVLALATIANAQCDCKCFPGEDCWPTTEQWNDFNKTVGGKLIATVPLAASCHDDGFGSYDEARCTEIQNKWLDPETHLQDSASVMAPFFANRSCDPFTDIHSQCVVGTYVQYAVKVASAADVSAGIKFVNEHNIRLVIRNTGHDYNGKSTGAGALSLWMADLKDIEIKDWTDKIYNGKAIKMGAGVHVGEAYKAADAQGLQVVGGECSTIGISGGYSQGGGHSALSSRHGLAADQALEWELVTGTGEHLVANRENNADLYWALSGGGGGTYAVVLSLTSKAHRDTPTAGANLTFTSEGISQDAYYEAISSFHASLPKLVDAGVTSIWYFSNETFAISPLTGPNITVDQLKHFLAPLVNKLDELDIEYSSFFGQFDTYLSFFDAMFTPIQVGTAQYGGRLIPRSVVETNNTALTAAYRSINAQGAQFIGVAVNASLATAGYPENAVNPAWRSTLIDTVITTPWNFSAPWESMLANQKTMTETLIPKLQELTPNGAAYLNEADFRQPDWKDVFYGANYVQLESIKNKYDPDHIFYATTAVGSDYWTLQEDGRLCKS
ncbi:hypothetical protein MBLNU13_g09126t1 [Cladosporium sp. NU13]